jgi:hypothetical protein
MMVSLDRGADSRPVGRFLRFELTPRPTLETLINKEGKSAPPPEAWAYLQDSNTFLEEINPEPGDRDDRLAARSSAELSSRLPAGCGELGGTFADHHHHCCDPHQAQAGTAAWVWATSRSMPLGSPPLIGRPARPKSHDDLAP